MKTDDRLTEGGGDGDQDQGNVVRLPREWIGPIEELVPFGPSARSAPTSSPHAAGADLTPRGADDFWGEDSAAVQDALQAPSEAGPGSFSSAREHAPRNTPRLHRPRRATAVVGVIAITIATPVIVIAAGTSAPKTAPHGLVAATSKPAGALAEAASITLAAIARDLRAASKLSAHTRTPTASQRSRRRAPVRAAEQHASSPPRANPESRSRPATETSPAVSKTQGSAAALDTPVAVHQPAVTSPTSSTTGTEAPSTTSSSSATGGARGEASSSAGSSTQNDLPTPGGPPPP